MTDHPLIVAARAVSWFDWVGNDDDADAAMRRLRQAYASLPPGPLAVVPVQLLIEAAEEIYGANGYEADYLVDGLRQAAEGKL